MDISGKLNGFGGADPFEIRWKRAILNSTI
jgi:hypothetical protein